MNGTSASAITAAQQGDEPRPGTAQLGDQEGQEEGGVEGVEPEPFRVAEQLAAVGAQDRPDQPPDVLRRRRPEQQPPVERAVLTAGQRERGVDAGLALERPAQRSPLSDGASAMPMARNRECMRVAAPKASPMPPPAPTIARAANWAEPPKTSAESATAWNEVNPACTASTPKDIDSTKPTAA